MRGKVEFFCFEVVADGITPAYAGKRVLVSIALMRLGDHPRVCGEKTIDVGVAVQKAGSPPRMRGKGMVHRAQHRPAGITPAYAGKSYHSRYMVIIIRDHPRVCGEKRYAIVKPSSD